jgi:carboxymethylenebutenolidase
MGEIVQFQSNGGTCPGYLAEPATGPGLPLVVIQEWWGLVPHIRTVADRFAAEGFSVLAPDLYRGEAATEPDGAGKLMMALNLDQAAKDMGGAVDFLRERTGQAAIGVTGFCMGGGLALVLACQRPDAVKVVVPWYGLIPWPDAQPDWSKLDAKVVGHYAALDGYFGPDLAHALETTLKDLGKDVTFFIYDAADHAFFNDTRPDVYKAEAADLAWMRTLEALRTGLV